MKRLVTTPPTELPIDLPDVKERLVIEHDEDDALIPVLIMEATSWAERYMDRHIMIQVVMYYFDCFENCLYLHSNDISSVVVTYDDDNNVEQTLPNTEYYLDNRTYPATVVAVNSWPITYAKPNTIRVEVTAGYSDVTQVPEAIKTGIMLLVGHLYNNREGSNDRRINAIPFGVESFLDKYRLMV